MWERIESIAKVGGLISALAAVISLAVSASQIRSDLRASEVREWQEVTVYSIVTDAGNVGISREQIRSKLQSAAPDYGRQLPSSSISTEALKRTLLSLTAK